MRRIATRAANIILHPETEWTVIARERDSWARCGSYLAPLALIALLAYRGRALVGGDAALTTVADWAAALRFALLSACSGLAAGFLLSTVAGYYASVAGLLAQR